MPRQFANRGDRLVFSNGVIVLGSLASLLICAFDADLNRLIQLYVVGVFTAFTLSQTGMIRHWLKEKHKGAEAQKGWRRSIVINTIGAVSTFVVLVIVSLHEVRRGRVDRVRGGPDHHLHVPLDPPALHGDRWRSSAAARVRAGELGANHVVLLVRDLDPATAEALGYLRSFRPADVHAVTRSPAAPCRPSSRIGGARSPGGGAGPRAARRAAATTCWRRCGPT